MKKYTRDVIETHSHYQLPYFLFKAPFTDLSNDARVLYAILYESMKYNELQSYIDDEGFVYCSLDRKDMELKLGLSPRTMVRVLDVLENKGLLKQERQGGGYFNRVYLRHPFDMP